MYYILFILSLVEGHLDCVQVLAIMNNAAINIIEQVSLWYDYTSFEYMSKSSILLDLNVDWFLIIWETAILISKVAEQVCTPTSNARLFPLLLCPSQHKLSLVFLVLAILTGVKWYHGDILICISMMAEDVEQFLKYLLAIWDSSVENSVFRSVPHF